MSPLQRWISIAVLLVAVVASAPVLKAQSGMSDEALEQYEFDTELEYYVRLVNGDVVSGPVTETSSDSAGAFIRIKTPFGRARLYAAEISWIGLLEESYRARNRGLILPTAEAIKKDHYLALVEGVMPTLGVGIADFVSITGGRTVIPGIGWQNQFSTVNIKGTVYEGKNGLVEGGKQIYAFGVNGSWINDVNFMGHVYGVATFTGKRTRVSTMIHAKVAGKDSYVVSGGSLFDPFTFPYANGTIGVAFMMDVRFPEMHDLHFLGELWNADLTRPSQSALFLGLRQCNTAITFDFGLTLLPGPNVAPALAVAWTPW
ncbi:MAG: hypothetical protein IPF59_06190 [Ignavibacteria bacterium]|nr:hypothetical protein [Ignavibacteria bacterium]MBK6419917.1 hypothetical protein [Ignavibacteria bacterium]